MPIDGYEQYKRVINQIIGGNIHACISISISIYLCISISTHSLETKKLFEVIFCLCACVVIYNNRLLIYLQSCVLKLVSELHDFI